MKVEIRWVGAVIMLALALGACGDSSKSGLSSSTGGAAGASGSSAAAGAGASSSGGSGAGGSSNGGSGSGGASGGGSCQNSLDCDLGQVCDTTLGRCVECVRNEDCSDPQLSCNTNLCVPGCASDNDCTALGLLCDFTVGLCKDPNPGSGGAGQGGSGQGGSSQGGSGAGGQGGSGQGGSGQGGSGASGQGGSGNCDADVVVLLDTSGSMADMGRWDFTTSGLMGFLATPGLGGRWALQAFPGDDVAGACTVNADCGPNGVCFGSVCLDQSSCHSDDYVDPLVSLLPAPAAVSEFQTKLAGLAPDGGTPTEPAIQGVYRHLIAQSLPPRDRVVVLITDGLPTSCNTDVTHLASVAAAASAENVTTYVLQVGGELTGFDAIAASGNTGSATVVLSEANVRDALIQAAQGEGCL